MQVFHSMACSPARWRLGHWARRCEERECERPSPKVEQDDGAGRDGGQRGRQVANVALAEVAADGRLPRAQQASLVRWLSCRFLGLYFQHSTCVLLQCKLHSKGA